jgi:hypothetical protein
MNTKSISVDSTDRAGADLQAQPLRTYRVTIKNGSREVRGFEAMGRDSMAVAEQHESLCADGEYIHVMPLAKWRAKLAAQFAGPLEGESTFSEADLIASDAARERRRDADPWGQAEADRSQRDELARMPLGGFLA